MNDLHLPPQLAQRVHCLANEEKFNARGRRYVLCWLQQTLRAEHNPLLDFAIALGNAHDLPVLVYHGLDNRYPYASHRLHRFILEASRSLEQGLAQRGVRFVRYVRRPGNERRGLVYELCQDAAALVTDDAAAYEARANARRVAQRIDIPLYLVDSALCVPHRLFASKRLDDLRTFRSAHKPHREFQMSAWEEPSPRAHLFHDAPIDWHDPLPASNEVLDALIATCDVDMSLPPAPTFHGSRQEAIKRLDDTEQLVLDRYNFKCSNPVLCYATSRLSPYLHFGVLCPREVARRVTHARHSHPAARLKYLDGLLTWREFAHHVAHHSAYPASWKNVPSYALDTLIRHETDARSTIYSLDALLHGNTHDETWNAAQKQFLLEGWMHNNLRLYWGKQIIGWTSSPKQAWMTACYLNDRLSLDGRDPATYGGIRWCFGEGTKQVSEQSVYGTIPQKTDEALRRRPGVESWLAEQSKRELRVDTPLNLQAVSERMGYVAS